MKILLVSSYLPYPLLSGGQVRLYNLLKELSKDHEITLICEKRKNQSSEDIKEVEKICTKVITVNRRKQWSAGNLLQSLVSSHSFLTIGHTVPRMREEIERQLKSSHFDLIHAETFYITQNIPDTTIPVVLIEHNIEYQVYERFAAKANLLYRPALLYDIYKMKKEEENSWRKAAAIGAVSLEDRKIIQTINPQVSLVRNGVNPAQFIRKDPSGVISQNPKKILYIGDFSWIQNRDTLSWIIKEIWPKIKSAQTVLWVVGREIPQTLKNLTSDPDIIFDEKSASRPAEQIFKEAFLLLAPIRVGGGTSYKILESMAVGTPVVMTPLSANALLAKDFHDALVGDTAEEISKKTLDLLNDHALYKKINQNSRLLIEKNYTWKAITEKLNLLYSEVLR